MFMTSQPQNLNPTGDFIKPMKQVGTENACITENHGNIPSFQLCLWVRDLRRSSAAQD